jgi:hypothetical protein
LLRFILIQESIHTRSKGISSTGDTMGVLGGHWNRNCLLLGAGPSLAFARTNTSLARSPQGHPRGRSIVVHNLWIIHSCIRRTKPSPARPHSGMPRRVAECTAGVSTGRISPSAHARAPAIKDGGISTCLRNRPRIGGCVGSGVDPGESTRTCLFPDRGFDPGRNWPIDPPRWSIREFRLRSGVDPTDAKSMQARNRSTPIPKLGSTARNLKSIRHSRFPIDPPIGDPTVDDRIRSNLQ